MKITDNIDDHLDQLVPVIEEYRQYCGAQPSPGKTRSFLLDLYSQKKAVTFLAIDEPSNNVMGFINLFPSYSTLSLQKIWILNDLGVAKKYRGNGVAKALIQKALSMAKDSGADRVELKTQKTNISAQQLYASLRFTIDEENIFYRVSMVESCIINSECKE